MGTQLHRFRDYNCREMSCDVVVMEKFFLLANPGSFSCNSVFKWTNDDYSSTIPKDNRHTAKGALHASSLSPFFVHSIIMKG